MAVIVKLTNTNKKRNSTKVITAFTLTTEAVLKQPTSVTDPTLLIEADETIVNYNYLYIQQFNRYYYIDDIVSVNHNLWEIRASVDALASFRDQIGENGAMILRSSYTYNTYLPDTLTPPSENVNAYSVRIADPPISGLNYSTGYYVISTVSNTPSGAQEGVCTYILSPTEYKQVFAALFNSYSGEDWGSITGNALKKALFDPTSYILSAYWFPVNFHRSSARTNFKAGLWDSGISCATLTGALTAIGSYVIDIPKHYDHDTGEYLNAAPYTEYYLDLGIMPVIRLDSSKMVRANSIILSGDIDPLTGIANIRCNTDGDAMLMKTSINYGVPVNLSVSKNNIVSTIGNLAQSAIGFATANPIAGATNLLQAGIGAAQSGVGVISGGVSGASLAMHTRTWYLHVYRRRKPAVNNDTQGRPLCEYRLISSVPGYIVTDRVSLSIAGAMSTEVRDIEALMNAGFYYE